MTEKILVATVALMVTRDAMTILPTTVPAHELAIQRAVFGRENVRVLDDKLAPVEIDPSIEAERLQQKYGGRALEKAYGSNFEQAIEKACAEHQVKAQKPVPKPAGDGPTELDAMSKAQLLAQADARGVKADASMNKAQIIEAIETAALA